MNGVGDTDAEKQNINGKGGAVLAERRMFAKSIVLSDSFLDMSLGARCLYFSLGMFADDDGFVNNPKSIMRQVGATTDDLNLLLLKQYVIAFESGVLVVRHWRIHNYIQKDRYRESKCTEEKARLLLDKSGVYTECIRSGSQTEPQDRLEQERLEQDRQAVVDEPEPNEYGVFFKKRNETMNRLGGPLGKNVVYLTDSQIEELLDQIGLDAFNRYVDRLASFILEKQAYVKNHYKMILKWYAEDTKIDRGERKRRE